MNGPSSVHPEPIAGEVSSPESEHHVYDGIVEHDNKLPLWWQLTLYGAIVFALVYWFGRRLDAIRSPEQNYAQEMARIGAEEAERARARGTIDDAFLLAIAKDPGTVSKGKDTFLASCAPCHRADGGGNIGPNLTDAYWLHGDKPTEILRTVSDGVPAKGMPTWGPQLGQDRTLAVVAFVLSLKDAPVKGGKAPQGQLASR